MSAIGFKSADVIFPWEDMIRTISFTSSDKSAVDVLSSLVVDKGMEIYSVCGFSVDETCFLSSYQRQKEIVSVMH